MRNAIGYIRVSSEEQADSGLGLEAQRQRIRAYCDMKGLSLVTIFEDAGVSGGKALATRPAGHSQEAAHQRGFGAGISRPNQFCATLFPINREATIFVRK